MKCDLKKFQIGEKVRLNTGGPEMSVEDIHGNTCVCRWFINGTDKTGTFVAQCLIPAVKIAPVIHGRRKDLTADRN